ncbi:MAG TPA: T9SS type A sorting domain-containing protein [Ignavibacteria bacterium]|nr:T9SS type A sorting domain-containing protein [Ignavibacteria bacterium]
MPLQVGNVWVYRTYKSGATWICYAYEKYNITGTSIVNNHTYYNIDRTVNLYNPICSTWVFPVGSRLFRNTQIRIDSNTTNIVSTENCTIDSLRASNGDTNSVCPHLYTPVVCGISNQLIFGYDKPAKRYYAQGVGSEEYMWYIKDFGFARYHLSQTGNFAADMILTGCVIDGVLYGDTNTLVGTNQISTEVPNIFSLSQNYPNPFNPVTKFKFSIPQIETTHRVVTTRLKIFDALGHEIAILVDQQLQPGIYEADWDASAYPSGVYYYKLESGSYSETKRMVLLK